MKAAEVINELKHLQPGEQAEVIQFALELARQRQLSGKELGEIARPAGKISTYCRSYSPLLTFLNTLKPAFLASEIETFFGELKVEKMRRTGFLQAGHLVN